MENNNNGIIPIYRHADSKLQPFYYAEFLNFGFETDKKITLSTETAAQRIFDELDFFAALSKDQLIQPTIAARTFTRFICNSFLKPIGLTEKKPHTVYMDAGLYGFKATANLTLPENANNHIFINNLQKHLITLAEASVELSEKFAEKTWSNETYNNGALAKKVDDCKAGLLRYKALQEQLYAEQLQRKKSLDPLFTFRDNSTSSAKPKEDDFKNNANIIQNTVDNFEKVAHLVAKNRG